MLRITKENRGGSLVEFAFAAPALLTIFFGIIEVGNIFWQKSNLDYAVATAARYAYVYPNSSAAQIQAYATSKVPAGLAITYSISIVPNSQVTITGTLTYTYIALIFLGITTLTTTVVQPLSP